MVNQVLYQKMDIIVFYFLINGLLIDYSEIISVTI